MNAEHVAEILELRALADAAADLISGMEIDPLDAAAVERWLARYRQARGQ